MTYIPVSELNRLREDAFSFLPATCTILRSSGSVDASGFTIQTSGTAGSNIACRIDPISRNAAEFEIAGRTALKTYRQFTTRYDTDLREHDTLVIASERYEVIQLDDDHSLNLFRRAKVVRLG